MERVIPCCFLATLLCAQALAAGQASPEEPVAALRANANLVVVDVVVADARHNPVHNLTTADFTVLENGHAQTIKTFEEHAFSTAAALPALPKLPPGTFTNYSPTPANGALNIVLLDTLNTPMRDQSVVRNQVLKYLKGARPGTRVAIFGLGTQLHLLQGFTSDPDLLCAVLSGKKGLAKGSPLMNDAVNGDNPGADDPMMDMTEDALGNDPSASQVIANLQQFEAEQQSFQLQLRARYTLDAFNQLARYLSGLPGRKNLIWFSASFPINILPDGDLQNPFAIVASSEDEFRETTGLLSRGQVAVYPIDARGLMTAPMLSAFNSGSRYARNPGAFAKDNSTFFQNTANEHSTMQAMAEATGGEAFFDTNGLKEAVDKAVEAGSNYYTLSYTPTNQQWKGDYRKIQIKVPRQGLTLDYRRGYYADDPNAPPRRGDPLQTSSAGRAPYDAMRAAMMRGGPDPTEITFAASVKPNSGDTEPTLAPGNRAPGKTTGPYRRYTVLFGINANEVACTATPDGVHHCALEVMIFVYNADGALLNTQSGEIKAGIPAARFASLQKTGIRFRQEISVPVKGELFLRIGIHDEATGRVGAVELPISAVSKLPPLSAAGPQ
jgi:VWFA-related protein